MPDLVNKILSFIFDYAPLPPSEGFRDEKQFDNWFRATCTAWLIQTAIHFFMPKGAQDQLNLVHKNQQYLDEEFWSSDEGQDLSESLHWAVTGWLYRLTEKQFSLIWRRKKTFSRVQYTLSDISIDQLRWFDEDTVLVFSLDKLIPGGGTVETIGRSLRVYSSAASHHLWIFGEPTEDYIPRMEHLMSDHRVIAVKPTLAAIPFMRSPGEYVDYAIDCLHTAGVVHRSSPNPDNIASDEGD